MNTASFDIVIAGGGLVGATLALAIGNAQPQLSIAIIEAIEPSAEQQPSFDARALAISHGSMLQLKSYGLWQHLAEHAEAIDRIQVSDRGHIGKSYLNAAQFDLKALGYVIEVRHIGSALHQLLKGRDNIQWYCPNTIAAIEQSDSQIALQLADGQKLDAKLLLVADGGQSMTRQLLNIDNSTDDYGQCAIIANIGVDKPHRGVAYERFTEAGPIALLPLTESRYSLVWCVKPEQVEDMLSWSDEYFVERLQQAFGYRAGKLTKAGKRFSYPLKLTLAKDIVAHRVALVGNASHTIHPIAGQGFNLGVRDIEALANMTDRFADDVGSFEALHYYKQSRQTDLNRVVGMTDSLVRLFSNDSKLLALGRTGGLLATELFDCLKRPIAYQSMGLNVNSL